MVLSTSVTLGGSRNHEEIKKSHPDGDDFFIFK